MGELRECPFCGGDEAAALGQPHPTRPRFAVVCECGAHGPLAGSHRLAISEWNRRAPEPPQEPGTTRLHLDYAEGAQRIGIYDRRMEQGCVPQEAKP